MESYKLKVEKLSETSAHYLESCDKSLEYAQSQLDKLCSEKNSISEKNLILENNLVELVIIIIHYFNSYLLVFVFKNIK